MMAAQAMSTYKVECYENWHRVPWLGWRVLKRRKPKLKWRDDFKNIVVNVGLNKLLDSAIVTGVSSPTWYVGLKDTGSVVAGDTMSSHGGWTEDTTYSNSTRPAFTAGSISGGAVDNSASKAVFNINGTTTIYGAFLVNNSTKGGTTGTLYGGGDFSASRSVASGDSLNVEIDLSITAS